MLQVVFLLFSWMPPPLNVLAGGIIFLTVVIVIVRLVAFVWDLLPFT